MALKKLHPRSGYGKIIDDTDGFTVFTVICQDDSQIEKALDDYLNDEREKVRATNIDSLIDTSRKRKKMKPYFVPLKNILYPIAGQRFN